MFRIESKPIHEIKTEVLVVNIFQDESKLPEDLMRLDQKSNGIISVTMTSLGRTAG